MKSIIPQTTESASFFPLENLPFGVFHLKTEKPSQARCCTRIHDKIIDLSVLESTGDLQTPTPVFSNPSLNAFMSTGKSTWQKVRKTLQTLFSQDSKLSSTTLEKSQIALEDATMCLPAQIGDYTDFYASIDHATNLGKMFRPNEEPLKPNWRYLPVGYHGRASSVVISGTNLKRPNGQKRPVEGKGVFGRCEKLDYELEMGIFVGKGNALGEPIKIGNAEEHIFGYVLMNDWSARDIQAWEYVPLGPFNGKNFGTTISPWIVTIDALEPFRVKGHHEQKPTPLEYLKEDKPASFDIKLEVLIGTEKTKPQVVSTSNAKYLYWSMNQMAVHHTSTGCNMRPGDLMGTGTISGPGEKEFGSIIELCWGGKKPFKVGEEERTFLEDGDTVILRGYCEGKGFKIGFGDCEGKVLPNNN